MIYLFLTVILAIAWIPPMLASYRWREEQKRIAASLAHWLPLVGLALIAWAYVPSAVRARGTAPRRVMSEPSKDTSHP